MPAPERLHIVVNAADGFDRGLPRVGGPLTRERVTGFIILHERLLRLMGWVAGNAGQQVLLSFDGIGDGGMRLTNRAEQPFTGSYVVAHEPAPFISQHGDYIFELEATGTGPEPA